MRQSCEHFRHDIDPEVGLASGPVAGMAVMLVGLVDHLDAVGRESILQLLCDGIFHEHARGLTPCAAPRQRTNSPIGRRWRLNPAAHRMKKS